MQNSFVNPKMSTKQVLSSFLLLLVGVHALPWVPVPRADSHFVSRHQHLLNQTEVHAAKEKIVFLGASIVEFWQANGKELWQKYYVPRHAFNYGLSGDRTENVLWRIEHGELDNVKAKVVVLFVGSNNRHDKPADVVKGLHSINEALKLKIPGVKIILMSIFPRGQDNKQVHEINKLLIHEEDKKEVFFLDVTDNFETTPEHINTTLYVSDHLHLTHDGYQVWHDAMEPLLVKLLQ